MLVYFEGGPFDGTVRDVPDLPMNYQARHEGRTAFYRRGKDKKGAVVARGSTTFTPRFVFQGWE
jgi:hypothetical protein